MYEKKERGIAEGLTSKEVQTSRAKYGSNKMSKRKKKSFFRQFVENLGDPVIKILIGALIINVLFTFRHVDWVENIGIAVSVLLAALISTLSEYGSQAAFERLESESGRSKFRVKRDGETVAIDIDDIVVGDIVIIGAGEQIPADCELISGRISCDQSAMTGESREVYKRAKNEDEEDITPSSPYYCLRGCAVTSGEGVLRVSAVGDKTFLGDISREIQEETRESPLKIRLTKLARQISTVGYMAAVLVALVYLFNTFVVDSAFDIQIIKYKLTSFSFLFSHLFHALTLALTVVVVAVPEGLPVMIAVVLSSNIKKMVRDNVLVRKPVGIESAGSMNILFTDKTGTLTEGKMRLGSIFLGDGSEYKSLSQLKNSKTVFADFLLNGFANTSSVVGKDSRGRAALGGNATERALLEASMPYEKELPRYTVNEKLPFDSDRKFSAASINLEKKRRIFVKGAPEKLIEHVRFIMLGDGKIERADRERLLEIYSSLTRRGKRVIAIAEGLEERGSCRFETSGLMLVCFAVLEDRIRREAADSVKRLRGAGIQVVMITGDGRETAESIARECEIIQKGSDTVITGSELRRMSDSQLKEILPSLAVVARALPTDKSRLVRISQELDLVVGMTGDGINDAPALKRADVGFSMGMGTQVAKDAGDVIILDNNLASIVKAVLYGRNIFKSIRKFISLQLMMNFCAVGVSMICPFLGVESPVTVVQMLWINIIMDTLGGLAFAGEGALESCMREKPKKRDEPILNGYMIYEIIAQGGFTVALCIAFWSLPEITSRYRWSGDNIYLLTAFFALFIFSSVFNCFNARTDRLRLLSNITKNKAFIGIMVAVLIIQLIFVYLGGAVLRTAPLTLYELAFTSILALTVFPFDFLRKILWRMLAGKKGY